MFAELIGIYCDLVLYLQGTCIVVPYLVGACLYIPDDVKNEDIIKVARRTWAESCCMSCQCIF